MVRAFRARLEQPLRQTRRLAFLAMTTKPVSTVLVLHAARDNSQTKTTHRVLIAQLEQLVSAAFANSVQTELNPTMGGSRVSDAHQAGQELAACVALAAPMAKS